MQPEYDLEQPKCELKLLDQEISIESFDCGNDDLNDFLRSRAIIDIALGRSCTFVESIKEGQDKGAVAGYFTLRAESLEVYCREYDPSEGTDDEVIEVPLCELMFLARDIRWRRRGIGKLLMGDVIRVVYEVTQRVGIIGMHLRSTPEAVQLYRAFDFVPFLAHQQYDNARYLLPISDIRKWINP